MWLQGHWGIVSWRPEERPCYQRQGIFSWKLNHSNPLDAEWFLYEKVDFFCSLILVQSPSASQPKMGDLLFLENSTGFFIIRGWGLRGNGVLKRRWNIEAKVYCWSRNCLAGDHVRPWVGSFLYFFDNIQKKCSATEGEEKSHENTMEIFLPEVKTISYSCLKDWDRIYTPL